MKTICNDSAIDIVFCSVGEVAERSKAAVLKTVEGQPSQGSNPCLSAKVHNSSLSIITFRANSNSSQSEWSLKRQAFDQILTIMYTCYSLINNEVIITCYTPTLNKKYIMI